MQNTWQDPKYWLTFLIELAPYGWTSNGHGHNVLHRTQLVHTDGASANLTLLPDAIKTFYGTASGADSRTKVRRIDDETPNMSATARAWANGPGRVRIAQYAEAMARRAAQDAAQQAARDAAASLRDWLIASNIPSPYADAAKGYYPPGVLFGTEVHGYRITVHVYRGGTDPNIGIQLTYLSESDIDTATAELQAVKGWLAQQRATVTA